MHSIQSIPKRLFLLPVLLALVMAGSSQGIGAIHAAAASVAPAGATQQMIMLTKPEWGLPAGSLVSPIQTVAGCLQPTAAIRAEALAGQLTTAQLHSYGLPNYANTATFRKAVAHDLTHICTFVYAYRIGPAQPDAATQQIQQVKGPTPHNLHNDAPCTWGGTNVCYAGYFMSSFQSGGWSDAIADWLVPTNSTSLPINSSSAFSTWIGVGGTHCSDNLVQSVTISQAQRGIIGATTYTYAAFIENIQVNSSCQLNDVKEIPTWSQNISPGDNMVASAYVSAYGTIEDLSINESYGNSVGTEYAARAQYFCVDEPIQQSQGKYSPDTMSGTFFESCQGSESTGSSYWMGDNSHAYHRETVDYPSGTLDYVPSLPPQPSPAQEGAFQISASGDS